MNLGLSGDDSPTWPPLVGLLHPLLQLLRKPRAQWEGDDWRKYAEHLEHAGYELACRLQQERTANYVLRAKLARKKRRELPRARGLLDADPWMEIGPKRGRPRGSSVEQLALEALHLQAKLKADRPGAKITAEAAISAVRSSMGQRAYQPKQNRAVRNAMSRLRKSQKLA